MQQRGRPSDNGFNGRKRVAAEAHYYLDQIQTLEMIKYKYKYKFLLDQIQRLEIKDKMRENSEGLFTCEGHQMLVISKTFCLYFINPPNPPNPSPQVSQN